MALHAMPFVMINLGTEMVYILEQRLKAQQIPLEKGNKVLKEVVLTMFDPLFYEEVFRPQEVYTIGATRQIFDRLAHSSIMRLSTASMDKLYDLMLMGLKYQSLCARKPEDILQVTMLHLNSVKSLVPDASVQARVEDVLQTLVNAVQGFQQLHWIQLRHTLARFLKDKRVKVSLFLQEGIQTQEGKILLPIPLPENPNTPQPGTIRALGVSGGIEVSHNLRMESVEVDTSEFHCHPHPLGANLYDKSRQPFKPPERNIQNSVVANSSVINSPTNKLMGQHSEKAIGTAEAMLAAGVGKAGKEELNALAQMIAPRRVEADNFKLNLFPDSDAESPVTTDISIDPVVKTIDIASASANANRQHLDKLMSEMDVGDQGGHGGDEDLLDLMDRAS